VEQRIRKNERVAFRELASGEGVLLHLETGSYHGVNQIGAALWTLIDGKRTASDLITELRARVTHPPAHLEDDVGRFLREMQERDLIAV
jgi:hypothetical protein